MAAAGALWLTAAPAALGAKVAALQPRLSSTSGTPSAELRNRFQDALARGLQQGAAGGVEVLSGSDVRARLRVADILGCVEGPCLSKAAQELTADRLVTAEIDVSGKYYSITVRLFDQGGVEMQRFSESCDICTVRQADEVLGLVAARLAPWALRPGPTDRAREATRAEERVTVTPPAPAPAPPPAPELRRTYFRVGWIAALAVGGAFMIASVPLLYYASKDGQTNCDPSVPRKDCPTIYQGNLGAGLGLLLGAGLIGGGSVFAVLYALDHRARRGTGPRVSLLPLLDGGMLTFEGRF